MRGAPHETVLLNGKTVIESAGMLHRTKGALQKEYDSALTLSHTGKLSVAFKRLRSAAEHGHLTAQHELARWYEQGEGVRKNCSEAFNWYLRAAEGGFSLAYWDIGRAYVEGKVVRRSAERALHWFMRLADPRTTEDPSYMTYAQWSLGELYSKGSLVPVNKAEAHKWFSLAAAYGEQRPKYLRGLLEKTMTKKELAEAQMRFDRIFIPGLRRCRTDGTTCGNRRHQSPA